MKTGNSGTIAQGGIQTAAVLAEVEHDSCCGGEQNSSPADSQTERRQIRPPRCLVKLQSAVLANRSRKADDGFATRTLSHVPPPPKGLRIDLHAIRLTDSG